MNGFINQLAVPLLFALMHTLLLSRFIPPGPHRTADQRGLALVLVTALRVGVQQLESLPGMTAYLYLAACVGVSFGFILLWSDFPWRAALQRSLCYVLLTECVTLTLCHASQRLLGADIFRSLPLWREALAMAGMGLTDALLLRALKHFFPAEALVDANSLMLSFLSAVPYLYVWRITIWLPIAHEDVPNAIILTMIASCALSLSLIVSLESRLFAEKEKQQAQAMQRMMELRQQQYLLKKNSIEQVRRQYHDMKNLLLYLEKAPTRENMQAHVARILDEIHPFENVLDTGNEVMDILLSEKLRQCESRQIVCTVIADGALLGFIQALDLVTIIGNAMDNAIEACLRVPPGQRFIQVRTVRQERFAILSFSNSCDGQASAASDRLLTRKHDRENHGFGLANIRRAIQPYGGEMRWRLDGDEFSLTLLFQLPAASDKAP